MHFDTQKSIPRSRLKYSVLAAHNKNKINPWHMHILSHQLLFVREGGGRGRTAIQDKDPSN